MIFVDSSAWIALLDPRDGFHDRARDFHSELRRGRHGRLVTTDYVLDEAITYLHLRAGASAARDFRDRVRSSESVQVFWTTQDRFWDAWEMLSKHDDKRWSLTDCVSFVTMTALGIRTVFGFDADFSQAGFELLPKHP